MKKNLWGEGKQSLGEEIANSISHGVGLLGALAITPVLIFFASRHSGAKGVIASSIFGATLILMYTMSTLYHSLPEGKAKWLFYLFDHCAIYILIAGSYTPFTLVVLGGGRGWVVFGVIWGLAALGVILKVSGKMRHPVLSTVIYLVMGWLILTVIKPLWDSMSITGIILLGGGGIAYSLGVAFFFATGYRYNHLVWHIFVLLGTACHILAVINYAK
ncbi:MAG: hemolysin III family protein [Candidatus Krumholzibacteriota bacterium]|nr:hemolysin III family protein [Candidatus Krumholzibacteriota bacterium]